MVHPDGPAVPGAQADVQNVRQNVHLRYAWDGTSIADVYEIRAINL